MMKQEDRETAEHVLSFWLDAGQDAWFSKNEAFDAKVAARFQKTYDHAKDGALDDWAEDPTTSVALIILLDQFSRNLHRDSALAFSQDDKALKIAKNALSKGYDQATEMPLRQFFYLPFQHCEDLDAQETSLSLYRALGDENGIKFAQIHYDIIEKFGRFPHRNNVLNRETTKEERDFLESGGFQG